MNNRILVTGGAGFIGSHLCHKLLKNNYQVICLDNFDPFYPKKFKEQNLQPLLKKRNFTFYKADIKDIGSLEKIIKNNQPYKAVVHLAAKAGVRNSLINPEAYHQTNVSGTQNLLKILKTHRPGKLIFASSSSVYGNQKAPFKVSSILKPLSPYALTKFTGEKLCRDFFKLTKISTIILRFFSVFGPSGRPDMAPYLFTDKLYKKQTVNIYGDGSSARDWTYIDDIINGILKAINFKAPFEIFNLGGNKPITLSTLISSIEKETDNKFKIKKMPLRKEEPKMTCADISKSKKLLNWQPQTDFHQGIRKFVKWYKLSRISV